MFVKHSLDGKVVILIVYVDDIVLTGNDVSTISELKKNLSSKFEMKDLGTMRYILGIEVARSKKGIVVSQRKYIFDLLKETGMSGCKPIDTPVKPKTKPGGDNDGVPVEKMQYQRRNGSI